MQFFKLAVLAGLAASVSAWHNETWVTTTVDVFTTVCPHATHLTFNGVTYTATESETITITNCPCTLSYLKPANTPCPSPSPVYANTTKHAFGPAGTSSPVTAPVATKHALTGAANRAAAGSAAGLAGLLVAAAYLL
jgi:hypothetical protein